MRLISIGNDLVELPQWLLDVVEAMPDNIKQTFAYNEGSRPRDYQQYLYDTRSGRGPVAPPGTSRHEQGQAIDVDRGAALDWLKANGAQFGLEGIRGDYPQTVLRFEEVRVCPRPGDGMFSRGQNFHSSLLRRPARAETNNIPRFRR